MSPRISRQLFAFGCVLLSVGCVNASSDLAPQASSSSNACRTDDSNDLYGLGLRLGYYSNWASAWTANNFVPAEIAGAQDSNSIFLLALLVSMVRTTVLERDQGQITRLDAVILLELCAGTILSVMTLWGYRTCVYSKRVAREPLHGTSFFGGFGTHFRLLLTLAVAAYTFWFFAIAARPTDGSLRVSGNPNVCGTIYVLSRSLPLVNRAIRIPAILFASISLCYYGSMALATVLGGITRFRKFLCLHQQGFLSTTTRLRYTTGLTEAELAHAFHGFRIFNFLWIIFAIVFIEVTLNLNHVNDVILRDGPPGDAPSDAGIWTPAQLLPMLIGIFSLIRMLYLAFEHARATDDDIAPSLGLQPSHHSGGVKQKPVTLWGRFKRQFLLYSVALAKTSAEEGKEEKDKFGIQHLDDIRKTWSGRKRLIVTWLPWVSLLDFWPWKRGEPQMLLEGLPLDDAVHGDDEEANETGHTKLNSTTAVQISKNPAGSNK